MRIGIDFDNTIICYDEVFSTLAKSWQLMDKNYQGNKQQLKEVIHGLPDGDQQWQRLQGKVYGEFINQAKLFSGLKEFLITCNKYPNIQLFIVSHKTEFGHFDEKRIPLRTASLKWLETQGFFDPSHPLIQESHVFFEPTREEKVLRIKSLKCTHFIDDLPEIFMHQLFPSHIKQFLFRPPNSPQTDYPSSLIYPSWDLITHAIFSN
jgi:hypothetical protein